MSETPAEYYASRAPEPLRGLDYLRKRIQNWFKALSVESKCYVIGLAVILLAAVLAVLKRPEVAFFAQAGSFIFALGLLPLIERLYEWAWRRLLGKLLIAALIALATNLAYGFGRQMVAALVGASPETFSATVNIATILIAPILFLMALAIGGIFIFAIALYIGSLALMAVLPSTAPGKRRRTTLWICRFVALAIAVFGSWHLLNHSTGYTAWVERRTASYLYNFDMYHDAQYATVKTEKVALLGGGRILIGSRDEDAGRYDFKTQHGGPRGASTVIDDGHTGPKRGAE